MLFFRRIVSPFLILALGASWLSGCVRVHAYQRETLSHRALQAPVWKEQARSDQHVFEVREATAGATGSTGGGCGCN